MSQVRRVLLVGHGGMGRRYRALVEASDRYELCGVVVGSEAGRARVAEELALPVSCDLEDSVTSLAPDLMILASPTEAHAAQLELAISRDIPCIVEKPVTDSPDACRRLIAQNASGRTPILVGHTLVFSPSFLRLLALLESGRLGVVRSASMSSHVRIGEGWTGLQADARETESYWTRGFLGNLVMHRLYLLNRVFAQGPDRVVLRGVALEPGSERLEAELRYGRLGNHPFSMSFGDEPSRIDLEIHTTRGILRWRSGEPGEALSFEAAPKEGETAGGAPREIPFGRGEPLASLVEAFAGFLDRGVPPYEGLEQGLSVLLATESLIGPLFYDPHHRIARALARHGAASGACGAALSEVDAEGRELESAPASGWERFLEPEARYSRWPEPEELAFSMGLKPVLYRTVPAAEAEEVKARFPEAHVEELPYGLAHERVQDRRWRDEDGDSHRDLFFSQEPRLAARAAAIYREQRVGEAIHEMGELLGYPSCCVAAFHALPDRSNNTALRYATWWNSTSGPGGAQTFDPWLNNLHLVATPFYPCRYDCAAAGELARSVAAGLESTARTAFLDLLAKPVLYLDDTRMVLFAGEADLQEVRYRAVSVPPARGEGRRDLLQAFVEEVVRWIAEGDRLRVSERDLRVYRGSELVKSWVKPYADLVRLFPFAGFQSFPPKAPSTDLH